MSRTQSWAPPMEKRTFSRNTTDSDNQKRKTTDDRDVRQSSTVSTRQPTNDNQQQPILSPTDATDNQKPDNRKTATNQHDKKIEYSRLGWKQESFS